MAKPTSYVYHAEGLCGPDTISVDGFCWPMSGADTLTEADIAGWITTHVAERLERPVNEIVIGTLSWTDIEPLADEADTTDEETGQ
jgi:hypothetical protein